jgi:hypothetical protein
MVPSLVKAVSSIMIVFSVKSRKQYPDFVGWESSHRNSALNLSPNDSDCMSEANSSAMKFRRNPVPDIDSAVHFETRQSEHLGKGQSLCVSVVQNSSAL